MVRNGLSFGVDGYWPRRWEATCSREWRASFLSMFLMCLSTVCRDSTSSDAIWRLVSPCVTRVATSRSRRVRMGGWRSHDGCSDSGGWGRSGVLLREGVFYGLLHGHRPAFRLAHSSDAHLPQLRAGGLRQRCGVRSQDAPLLAYSSNADRSYCFDSASAAPIEPGRPHSLRLRLRKCTPVPQESSRQSSRWSSRSLHTIEAFFVVVSSPVRGRRSTAQPTPGCLGRD